MKDISKIILLHRGFFVIHRVQVLIQSTYQILLIGFSTHENPHKMFFPCGWDSCSRTFEPIPALGKKIFFICVISYKFSIMLFTIMGLGSYFLEVRNAQAQNLLDKGYSKVMMNTYKLIQAILLPRLNWIWEFFPLTFSCPHREWKSCIF